MTNLQAVEMELTEMEIANAVFVTEQEAGLHAGLTFEQWYTAKTEVENTSTGKIISLGEKEIVGQGGCLIKRKFYLNEFGNKVQESEDYHVKFEGKLNAILETISNETGMEWKTRNKNIERHLLNTPSYITKNINSHGAVSYTVHFDINNRFFIAVKKNKKTGNYWLISE